jgi:hypothetical protein
MASRRPHWASVPTRVHRRRAPSTRPTQFFFQIGNRFCASTTRLSAMARPLGHDACLRHSAPQCTHQSAADAATHARVRDCRLDGALPGGNFKTYKAACVDRNADSIITACMHACKLKHALGHPEPEDRERSSRVVPNGGGCWARLYKTRAELWVQ